MKQRRDDSCQLVIGLMFWSDSTHLAQFGHALGWPVYLFFRNLSKYAWANPQLGIVIRLHSSLQWGRFIFLMLVWRSHHFEQLPESIKQLQSSITNKKNNYDLLTLCKWDLFHAVWRTMFDDEFIEAYKNGIVIKCFNRVTSLRRVYSKFLLTWPTIQKSKLFWCPVVWVLNGWEGHHCYHLGQRGTAWSPIEVPSHRFPHRPCCKVVSYLNLLTGQDRTCQKGTLHAWKTSQRLDSGNSSQRWIPCSYTGKTSLSSGVSLLMTSLSFLELFLWAAITLGIQMFPMIIIDLLHEFELGILKSVLTHLLWIIYVCCQYSWNRHFQWIGNRTGLDNLCR